MGNGSTYPHLMMCPLLIISIFLMFSLSNSKPLTEHGQTLLMKSEGKPSGPDFRSSGEQGQYKCHCNLTVWDLIHLSQATEVLSWHSPADVVWLSLYFIMVATRHIVVITSEWLKEACGLCLSLITQAFFRLGGNWCQMKGMKVANGTRC